tara:strand:- start:6243 stop:6746 length:504 start_codon:yes stop_codon:yes gene_type:complete
MVYEFDYGLQKERPSFVNKVNNNIIFGIRDQKTVENSIRANYNFNTKQGLSLSARQFWSTASFGDNSFQKLIAEGELEPTSYDTNTFRDPDANFNIWNLDLSYRWQFAPGSEAVLLYRNSIFNEDKLSELKYSDSLDNLFSKPARHNLSLRVVYFIDYNNLRNIFRS